MKVLVVFGTRPEAVKMCPLVLELKKYKEVKCKVCLTGQHKEMISQVMECFEVKEDYNLEIMKSNQSLTGITTAILERMEPVLQKELPDVVLVHGDTTTSFAAALAAFYQKIAVGHVEAGLRTGHKYSPFPEEINRNLTAKIATYHFAPTLQNKLNLKAENIVENVFVTGNTVIDAFATTVKENYVYHNKQLAGLDMEGKRVLLMTAHRRENLGIPLENICNAIKRIKDAVEDVVVIYPVHMNPKVREIVYKYLGQQENIILTEPLDVLDMHNLIADSYLVLTDSGGLQEEAPAFGKPVLVMRKETERPEAVAAGIVKVVGVEEEEIYNKTIELLCEKNSYERMSKVVNPYGDGNASKRITEILIEQIKK